MRITLDVDWQELPFADSLIQSVEDITCRRKYAGAVSASSIGPAAGRDAKEVQVAARLWVFGVKFANDIRI